jgi:hypothetical protein
MEQLTYQQVLADTYEENAKSTLVFQTEYTEEDVPAHDKHPHAFEVENPDEFNEFKGSRQIVEVPKDIPKFEDKTKLSVRAQKDIATHVINIDSRFRTRLANPPSNFLFSLLTPIKNAASIRLASIEIPNTWYTFSEYNADTGLGKDNTSMIIIAHVPDPADPNIKHKIVREIRIPDANYSAISDPDGTSTTNDTFIADLEYFTNIAFETIPEVPLLGNSYLVFSYSFDINTSKITISCKNNLIPSGTVDFEMDFGQGRFGNRDFNFGLGYNIGFRSKTYPLPDKPLLNTYTGEAVPDIIGSNYIFLTLHPDWKVVMHNQPDKSQVGAFAKIVVNAAKNDVIYDNGANTITKEYKFRQPTNISTFPVTISDEFEEVLDLLGANMSLTIEIDEIINSSLYDHIREL